jgi:hypothetical protein
MAVFRVEKTRDYTVMANHHLKNRALTLKAKGLMSLMLSLPEDWDYTLKGLSLISVESIDAIREAVKELERAGYILRSRERNSKGQLKGSDYIIYELPHTEDGTPASDNPTLENPTQDKPTQETPALASPVLADPTQDNPTQLNTNRATTNSSKTQIENTHAANPYQSNPYPSNQASDETGITRLDRIGCDEAQRYREIVKENIEYDILITDPRAERERLDEIVDLMVETLCSTKPYISVAGDEYPASLVKSKLLKLNSMHIDYVFECLNKNTTYVRNIKRYLLATLFNAPSTIGSYYSALVNHDMYGDGSR